MISVDVSHPPVFSRLPQRSNPSRPARPTCRRYVCSQGSHLQQGRLHVCRIAVDQPRIDLSTRYMPETLGIAATRHRTELDHIGEPLLLRRCRLGRAEPLIMIPPSTTPQQAALAGANRNGGARSWPTSDRRHRVPVRGLRRSSPCPSAGDAAGSSEPERNTPAARHDLGTLRIMTSQAPNRR